MRVTLRVPLATRRAVVRAARAERTTISAVVERALREYAAGRAPQVMPYLHGSPRAQIAAEVDPHIWEAAHERARSQGTTIPAVISALVADPWPLLPIDDDWPRWLDTDALTVVRERETARLADYLPYLPTEPPPPGQAAGTVLLAAARAWLDRPVYTRLARRHRPALLALAEAAWQAPLRLATAVARTRPSVPEPVAILALASLPPEAAEWPREVLGRAVDAIRELADALVDVLDVSVYLPCRDRRRWHARLLRALARAMRAK